MRTLSQAVTLCAGLVLGIEAYLLFSSGASLCDSAGCRLAGESLRIEEPVLVALGAGFFLFLTGVLSLSRWLGRDWPWWAAATFLFGALAFDGGLLGYQFMEMNERCILCISVGACLGLTLLLMALERRSWMIPVFGFAVFSGGFTGNAVIKPTLKLPMLEETAFLNKKAEAASSLKLYLYFSLHCEECAKLLKNLAANENRYAEWFLSATDREQEDLLRLAEIKERVSRGDDPFQSILDVKSKQEVSAGAIPEEIRRAVDNARALLLSNHHTTLPVLIAEEGEGKRIISEGLYNIKGYLMHRKMVTGQAISTSANRTPAGG
jgi:uncharacterized membrane protein